MENALIKIKIKIKNMTINTNSKIKISYSLSNSPYTEALKDAHNEQFIKNTTLINFKWKMASLSSQVDERFLKQFQRYEAEVSALLSENIAIVDDIEVQEAIASENTRIEFVFKNDTEKLARKYRSIFLWDLPEKSANDDNYLQGLDNIV